MCVSQGISRLKDQKHVIRWSRNDLRSPSVRALPKAEAGTRWIKVGKLATNSDPVCRALEIGLVVWWNTKQVSINQCLPGCAHVSQKQGDQIGARHRLSWIQTHTLTDHMFICDTHVYVSSPPQAHLWWQLLCILDRLCRSVFWKSPSDASGTRNSISRSQMQYTRCLQKINSHRRSQAQLHLAHRYFIIKTIGIFLS